MNILFLSHRLPYAPNRGDRIRAYHLIHEMSRWATIDVISLAHDDEEASHSGDLGDVTRSVTIARVPKLRNYARAALSWPTSRPTTHSLLDSTEMNAAVDAQAADTETRRGVLLLHRHCTRGVQAIAHGRSCPSRHGGRGFGEVGIAGENVPVPDVLGLSARGESASFVRGGRDGTGRGHAGDQRA